MAIYNTYTILTAEKAGIGENLRIGVVQMCKCAGVRRYTDVISVQERCGFWFPWAGSVGFVN